MSRNKYPEITIENILEVSQKLFFEKGYDEKYGARPLRRAVEQYLEDPLAEAILRGDVRNGTSVKVSCDGGKLVFKTMATDKSKSSEEAAE